MLYLMVHALATTTGRGMRDDAAMLHKKGSIHMETVNEVSLVIRNMPYDLCEREHLFGTGCDKDYEACHRRTMSEIADRLERAFEHDASAFGGCLNPHAMDGFARQIREWEYDPCMGGSQCTIETSPEHARKVEQHRQRCTSLANEILHAWVNAMPNDTGVGTSNEGKGDVIYARPDARDQLSYVVAWEPDVNALTVRDPRDVSPARFETLGAFPSYESASAFIHLIEEHHGDGRKWQEHTKDPFGYKRG